MDINISFTRNKDMDINIFYKRSTKMDTFTAICGFIYYIDQYKYHSYLILSTIAWEPSVAQGTHSYSRCLPARGRKLRFSLFFPIKVDPINLESQNQAKNIPVVLPSSPIKTWEKSVLECLSYDRTHKQRNKRRLLLYIFSRIAGNPALPRLLNVTPAVYPHLNDFTGKLNFRY